MIYRVSQLQDSRGYTKRPCGENRRERRKGEGRREEEEEE